MSLLNDCMNDVVVGNLHTALDAYNLVNSDDFSLPDKAWLDYFTYIGAGKDRICLMHDRVVYKVNRGWSANIAEIERAKKLRAAQAPGYIWRVPPITLWDDVVAMPYIERKAPVDKGIIKVISSQTGLGDLFSANVINDGTYYWIIDMAE